MVVVGLVSIDGGGVVYTTLRVKPFFFFDLFMLK